MERLEREARSGDVAAEFYNATLLDPDLELSTIMRPDAAQAIAPPPVPRGW